jgi:hypothetical protein
MRNKTFIISLFGLVLSALLIFEYFGVTQAAENNKVIIYYFHREIRCHSCLEMEAFTKETVDKYYAGEQKAGSVIFKAVNWNAEENRHFEDAFKLVFNSVVIVKMEGSIVKKWDRLDKCWDYLDNKKAFAQYIKNSLDLNFK